MENCIDGHELKLPWNGAKSYIVSATRKLKFATRDHSRRMDKLGARANKAA